ncbi:MAG: GNAT family N-acetyltransferase [Phycisphaerae bacterium]
MLEEYEIIRPTDRSLISRGLDCILSEAENAGRAVPADLAERRQAFDAYCALYGLDTSRQVLALRGQQIIGVCLWVATPGRTALFYIPQTVTPELPASVAQVQCIIQAARDAAAAGMALGQVILPPEAQATAALYRRADFSDLATLLYMHRHRPLFQPSLTLPSECQVITYTPDSRIEFAQTIQASYAQTLDCPRLSNLRNMDDVMVSHQGNTFDPALWFLLKRSGRNAGVLLLAQRPENAVLELVYLGLVPHCRGIGLGTQLVKLALQTVVRMRAAGMTLAVDRANTPAVHLYRSQRFEQTAERQVLIHPFPASISPTGLHQ